MTGLTPRLPNKRVAINVFILKRHELHRAKRIQSRSCSNLLVQKFLMVLYFQ